MLSLRALGTGDTLLAPRPLQAVLLAGALAFCRDVTAVYKVGVVLVGHHIMLPFLGVAFFFWEGG